MRISVLGAGLIGRVIARELAAEEGSAISVFDADPDALERVGRETHASIHQADLSRWDVVAAAVKDADAVVGALPGALGFAMLRTVIEAGKPVADISFSGEDPLQLEALARERGATAVVDCGVSPVVEEYRRPARVFEDGKLVTRPALSGVERIDVAGIGTLEAFLTDGLRTLLRTVPARNMTEKTLRYPGHAEKMEVLREAGFFDDAPIEVRAGVSVVPRELTSQLLSRAWRLADDEFTYLKVVVTGRKLGKTLRTSFELLDKTHRATGTTSMARTTAFPCAVVARMLARGEYRDPGVRPLEMLAANRDAAARLELGLTARGIRWTKETTEIAVE